MCVRISERSPSTSGRHTQRGIGLHFRRFYIIESVLCIRVRISGWFSSNTRTRPYIQRGFGWHKD